MLRITCANVQLQYQLARKVRHVVPRGRMKGGVIVIITSHVVVQPTHLSVTVTMIRKAVHALRLQTPALINKRVLQKHVKVFAHPSQVNIFVIYNTNTCH